MRKENEEEERMRSGDERKRTEGGRGKDRRTGEIEEVM